MSHRAGVAAAHALTDTNESSLQHVVLFYHYFSKDQVLTEDQRASLRAWQEQLCRECGLVGRVLVSVQGLNGTLSGSLSGIQSFKDRIARWRHPGADDGSCGGKPTPFDAIDWKQSTCNPEDGAAFPDLIVKAVKELVASGGMQYDIHGSHAGHHLSPEEFHAALKETNPDDLVVIDVRNRFEHAIGHFVDGSGRAALDPNMRNFTQFKHYIDEQGPTLLKDKKVLMYCTGGIRCETASAYVQSKGWATEVCQLSGGIHRYCEKYGPQGLFRGKNFVFDRRIAVSTENRPANHAVADVAEELGDQTQQSQTTDTHDVVGCCSECGDPFDDLSGGIVCTVCVCLVLVCHECRARGVRLPDGPPERRRWEWYCKEHAYLRGIYFTFLERFSDDELKQQQESLRQILHRTEKEGPSPRSQPAAAPKIVNSGANDQHADRTRRPKQQKRKRNNDPKQRALCLQRQLRKIDDQLRQRAKRGQPSTQVVQTGPVPCRCCMQPECQGFCWGVWKALAPKPTNDITAKREPGRPVEVQ